MTESTPPRRGVPIWAQIIVWVILVALLVVVAMGLRRAQQGTVQPGQKIENFTLNLFSDYEYEGKTQVTMEELRGKVVVINFWASWCKPCEQEAAEMEQVWRMYKDGGKVVFLGVDWVDTEPEAKGYIKKFDITYANGPDLRTSISQLFRIKGVPETYLIGKDGKLADFQIGPYTTAAQLQGMIEPLLK